VPSRFKACLKCYKAKARCEEVDTIGCHRCRSKHLDCSLSGVLLDQHQPLSGSSNATHTTTTPQSTVSDIERRLESIEVAITAIQSTFHDSQHIPTSISPQTFSLAQPSAAQIPTITGTIPKRFPDSHAFRKVRQMNPSAVTWGETLTSCWTDPNMYPDVVARGLLAQSQVDLAFPM